MCVVTCKRNVTLRRGITVIMQVRNTEQIYESVPTLHRCCSSGSTPLWLLLFMAAFTTAFLPLTTNLATATLFNSINGMSNVLINSASLPRLNIIIQQRHNGQYAYSLQAFVEYLGSGMAGHTADWVRMVSLHPRHNLLPLHFTVIPLRKILGQNGQTNEKYARVEEETGLLAKN